MYLPPVSSRHQRYVAHCIPLVFIWGFCADAIPSSTNTGHELLHDHAGFTFGTRLTATDHRHWWRSCGIALGICAHGLSVNGTFYIGVIRVLTIVTVRPPFLARGTLCHEFMFGAHPEGPDFVRKARFYHYVRPQVLYFQVIILYHLFFWTSFGATLLSKSDTNCVKCFKCRESTQSIM